MKKQYITSIILSALLWLVLPVAMELLDDTNTAHRWFAFFSPVAALMHALFGKITKEIKGWKFWLLPLVTLPIACVVFCCVLLVWGGISKGFEAFSFPGLFYGFFPIVFIMVLGFFIWLSYPLAILNQFLIRWALNGRGKKISGCDAAKGTTQR